MAENESVSRSGFIIFDEDRMPEKVATKMLTAVASSTCPPARWREGTCRQCFMGPCRRYKATVILEEQT